MGTNNPMGHAIPRKKAEMNSFALWTFLQRAPRMLFSATPNNPAFGMFNQVRGMKYKTAIKKRCVHCQMVKRGKRLQIICKKDPKHKQKQGRGSG